MHIYIKCVKTNDLGKQLLPDKPHCNSLCIEMGIPTHILYTYALPYQHMYSNICRVLICVSFSTTRCILMRRQCCLEESLVDADL